MPRKSHGPGRKHEWRTLPGEFAYLKEPAERFAGVVSFDGKILRRLTAPELRDLEAVAQQVGWRNHELPLRSWSMGQTDDEGDVCLIDELLIMFDVFDLDITDYGPKEEPDWTLHQWDTLDYRVLGPLVAHTRGLFTDEDAFRIVTRALDRVPKKAFAWVTLELLRPFRSARSLDWLESHMPNVAAPDWGYLAAVSEFSWSRAKSWLECGRPLSLVALDAMRNMNGNSESPIVQEVAPILLDPDPYESVDRILREYVARDPAPRVKRAVATILENWAAIVGQK
jgi:hypothetical protein